MIVSSKWSGNTNPNIESGFATFHIGNMPPLVLHLQSFQVYQELDSFIDYVVAKSKERLAEDLKTLVCREIDKYILKN